MGDSPREGTNLARFDAATDTANYHLIDANAIRYAFHAVACQLASLERNRTGTRQLASNDGDNAVDNDGEPERNARERLRNPNATRTAAAPKSRTGARRRPPSAHREPVAPSGPRQRLPHAIAWPTRENAPTATTERSKAAAAFTTAPSRHRSGTMGRVHSHRVEPETPCATTMATPSQPRRRLQPSQPRRRTDSVERKMPATASKRNDGARPRWAAFTHSALNDGAPPHTQSRKGTMATACTPPPSQSPMGAPSH